MCGIAGMVRVNNHRLPVSFIEIITQALHHRGPDGEGYYKDDDVQLGHQRLAIIDISPAGKQPMHYANYILVYNGEIYNYLELRNELENYGYHFNTKTDTEVVLKAYDYWGENCLHQFNGMFAFAIYNTITKQLFCARDAFGMKPFYYATINNYFVFASEIKAILQTGIQRRPNLQKVQQFIWDGQIDADGSTFFEGVQTLKAGHSLVVQVGSTQAVPLAWFNIAQEIQNVSAKGFQTLFNKSIQQHLRADVAIGISLSGGIDSSAIALAVTQNSAAPIQAFTGVSDNAVQNEAAYAQLVASHLKLPHCLIQPTQASFAEAIDTIVAVQEEPFADPSVCMQFLVMQAVAENGVRVLLSGQGADELLKGYRHHYFEYLQTLGFLKRIIAFCRGPQIFADSWIPYCKNYLYNRFPKLKELVLRRKWKFYFKQPINKAPFAEIVSFPLPAMLRYEDKNSMHFSIESRLPFLDRDVALAALTQGSEKIVTKGYTKYALRQFMLQAMPEAVVLRKHKLGYPGSLDLWMKDISAVIKNLQSSTLLQQILPASFNFSKLDKKDLFKLWMLVKWEHQFLQGA
jgi:asparagine synthase (glutamine-hydrolysing)